MNGSPDYCSKRLDFAALHNKWAAMDSEGYQRVTKRGARENTRAGYGINRAYKESSTARLQT